MPNRRDPASYAHPTDRFREPSELDMVDDWRPTREDREAAERTHGPLMEALDRAIQQTRGNTMHGFIDDMPEDDYHGHPTSLSVTGAKVRRLIPHRLRHLAQ